MGNRIIEMMDAYNQILPQYSELKKKAVLSCVRKEYSTAGNLMYFRGIYNQQLSITTASNYRRGRKTKDWPKNRVGAYEYFFDEKDELIYLRSWADEIGVGMEEFIQRMEEKEFSVIFTNSKNCTAPNKSIVTLCEMGDNRIDAFHCGNLDDKEERITLLFSENYDYVGTALKRIHCIMYDRDKDEYSSEQVFAVDP